MEMVLFWGKFEENMVGGRTQKDPMSFINMETSKDKDFVFHLINGIVAFVIFILYHAAQIFSILKSNSDT
ncbi:hypothetical protein Lal_00024653 [Lupinus albus]|nr:hypothetical protein Lal_00024653 [Lupinus albus]